ncbi:MAG: hypothetical protein J1E64_01445 [Acetatifactor sp.]|nr:hypothetical protein [Acetatifactor sp.]
MKKSNLIFSILYTLGGAALLFVALLTDSVLDSLLFGFAAGSICSGTVMTCKYFYWSSPKNREKYQEKLEAEKIELHDEMKEKVRDKAGKYTCVLGAIVVSISIVVFSILGKLGLVENSRMIVLYLGGYLLFQIAFSIAIFQYLLKKY